MGRMGGEEYGDGYCARDDSAPGDDPLSGLLVAGPGSDAPDFFRAPKVRNLRPSGGRDHATRRN